jgi:parallel beta-helix repeat protein
MSIVFATTGNGGRRGLMFCRRTAHFVLALLVIVPAALAQDGKLWVGPNVNMVSGTTFPDGDPFLQRQNEPSVAVSTRNPLHLLAGANDYRAVDIPGLPEGKETGDSWLGVFKSVNGGSTWRSYLLPGYPQDQTPEGLASPLKGFDAGADPVVRAGTDGLFYYAGLVFVRENLAQSAIFVARFEDLNNDEQGDPITQIDTQIVTTASGNLFVDKPWMAVDIPRGGAQCGNVYVAWAEIDSSGLTPTSRIMFSTSTDCGANWVAPIQLSSPGTLPQGATIAVSPTLGHVYVAWRQHTSLSITECFFGGGHWKNHPEEWPVETVTIGGVTYTKPEAIAILDSPVSNDATYIVARALIAAKLNQLEYVDAIAAALVADTDAWLVANPLGSKPKKEVKEEGILLKEALEAYNSGLLGSSKCEVGPPTSSNAIMVVKSINDGASFGPPNEVAPVHPFDQGTSPYSFRSNSYPTMTIDETERVYLAWTTRGLASGLGVDSDVETGDARIVVSTSPDGMTWTNPQPIDQPDVPGHQIKPSLTYTGGQLLLTYYDFREDASGVYDRFVADLPSIASVFRHTVDVRGAAAAPGETPVFTDYTSLLGPSARLSRYAYLIAGEDLGTAEEWQLQYNPPALPMFQGGVVPFFSDYLDSAAAPPFVPNGSGGWTYNTNPNNVPVAHAVWTDNRDVVGPPDGDWTSYVPPAHANSGGTSIFDPNQTVPVCNPETVDVDRTRMRNQNIYTARLTQGLFVGIPGNSRPLGEVPGSPGDLLQRAFVVFVQNATDEERSFQLWISEQPTSGEASFQQFEFEETAEVTIEPHSSASRTVFVTSDVQGPPWPSVEIDVTEMYASGTPLHSTVLINPDPWNPTPADPGLAEGELYNPSIYNPSIYNPSIYNPSIFNPSIYNPSIFNPSIYNPSIYNPSIFNPSIYNPSILNPSIYNPSIYNPSIYNPSIYNPSIYNPSIYNPSIFNPSIYNASLTDVTWTVKNEGNATSAYSFNLLAEKEPPDFVYQLMIYRVYTTPVADGCELTQEGQQETLVNILDPDFESPDLLDPNTFDPEVATFYLGPGEEAFITLRVWDEDPEDDLVFEPETVKVAAVAQGANTEVVLQGGDEQSSAVPDISVPTSSSMNNGRSQHTSTLLPDGTILITGGFNPSDILDTAEIYDPVYKTFTPTTGNMGTRRYFHTATLLKDGKVLIVGGSSTGWDAEIYDPDDRTFSPTSGDTVVRRGGHRATLLTDGRVLVTGGTDGVVSFASAEIYDPASDDFTLLANTMNSARWEHSATLLTTGEVLIAGGYDGVADQDTAEVFDPTSTFFHPVPGTMTDPRRFHSGTLLPDGTVLLAGGYFDSTMVANSSADIYDRDSNSLIPAGTLVRARSAHTATLMADGKVMLAGGRDGVGASVIIHSHIELYDWSTGAFIEKGDMTIAREEHTAVGMPDGKVLITGGTTYGTPLTTGTDNAELYVPAEPAKFKKIGDLATERLFHMAATLPGGDVIVVGGLDGDDNVIASIERFSPATGQIATVATLPTSRMFQSTTLLDDGTVLIAGGSPDNGATVLDTALIYDPSNDSLTPTTGPLGTARWGHTATLLQDGRVLIASGTGSSDTPLASTEIYDPVAKTFSSSDSLATARRIGGSAVLLDDGRVLIAGGRTAGLGVTAAFQLWDPATETFGPEGSMNESRRSHRHTLLVDGTVLIAGGRNATFDYLDTAEIFDPTTNTFTYAAGTMQLRRRSQTQALLPSGEVLLAGGITDGRILVSYGEIYDPVTQTFRLIDVLTSHRSGARSTRLADGRILIVGGLSSYRPGELVPTSTVEVYNPWDMTGEAKAAFTAQPKDVPIGGIMSPGVQVAVFEDDFVPIASVPVTLQLEDYFGGDTKSWVRTTNANGIATFNDVWFDRIGPGRRMFAEVDPPGPELSTGLSEPFEVLPLVVTNTHDDGPGSLRRAIENAERNVGYTDFVGFNIGGAGPHEISVTSELPLMHDSVLIDGRTQPGYVDEPLIKLNGSSIPYDPSGNHGIQILGNDSLVAGLTIVSFDGSGIRVVGTSGVQIHDNFVGIDAAGVGANYEYGIRLEGSSGTEVIGNVVSGNGGAGVYLEDGSTGALISDNYLGTDISGTLDRGNAGAGISLRGSGTANNTVSGNLISGNSSGGIAIWEGANTNTVTENLIGTDVGGTLPIGNGYPGIWISEGFANTIGGTGPDDGNVIAAAAVEGILVENTVGLTTIQGNLIGTNTSDPSIDTGLGNGSRGIVLLSATDTVIGGADPAARNYIVWNHSGIGLVDSSNTVIEGNLISGSTVGTGIVIQSSDVTEVYSNYIGTNADGTAALGNNRGMIITEDVTNVVVGGPTGRNIISGNRTDGIFIACDTPVPGDSILIENNYIGTDKWGESAIPNEGQNVDSASGILTQCDDDIIRGNLISGNGTLVPPRVSIGIRIWGSANTIEDNLIGTKADGVSPLENTGSGVQIHWGGSDNRIQNNTIAFNGGDGIEVLDGIGNTIGSNSTFANVGLGIDLGGDGVTPNDSPGDGDTGPNALVNFPVLTEATDNGTNTVVRGTLDTPVSGGARYGVLYYVSDECDPSNFGEGQTLAAIPYFIINFDPSGVALLYADDLPTGLVGKFITATASSEAESYSTSEFSECIQVVSGGP